MNAWENFKTAIAVKILPNSVKSKLTALSSPVGFNSLPWLTGLPRANAVAEGDAFSNETVLRRSELTYACIECKSSAVCDPEIIVERRDGLDGEWKPDIDHPLVALLNKPNPYDDGESFRRAWVASEAFSDAFYVEVTRNKAGQPVELYPLHPARLKPHYQYFPNGSRKIDYYEYTIDSYVVKLSPDELLIRRRHGLQNIYSGVSAVQVALGSIEADLMQSNFIRSFFLNDGTPSGVLKISGRKMTEEEAAALRLKWRLTYGIGGTNYRGVAILDQQADYQSIGAKMSEAGLTENTAINEARICSVFGVPPILVGAWVGLVYVNQRASVQEAQKDFWDNTLSPELKSWRNFLTWSLLPEFEDIEMIKAGRVRVNWDMTQVKALHENVDDIHDRARKDYASGLVTLNEARSDIGLDPTEDDEIGDQFFKPPSPQLGVGDMTGAVAKLITPAANGKNGHRTNGHSTGGNLEKKTFDFDGLILGREPTEIERTVLDLKAISAVVVTIKEILVEILAELRVLLIGQVVDTATDFTIDELYEMSLSPPEEITEDVLKTIERAIENGRRQVIQELRRQGLDLDPADITIDTETVATSLTGATVTRVTNEIQARATSQIATDAVLGLTAAEVAENLEATLLGQSTAWVDSYAGGAANAAMQTGRAETMQVLDDRIDRYEYSAVMDENTCGYCEAEDGTTSTDINDLVPVPNAKCDGRDRCRCIIIAVVESEAPAEE